MYQKSILPNGIRVITEELPYVKSVSLGLWIASGSRHEQDHNQGISHFIEHLLFKGTVKRSAKDIVEQIDEIGGQLNAFTSKEFTCYYVKLLDTHLDLGIDILSDMLLHAKFDSSDMEREREVVMEEYNMYEDTPDELIHEIYMNTIMPDHPLGRNILGTRESIPRFDSKLVQEYYQNFYRPNNMVVAASGNLTHQALLQYVQQHLGGMTGCVKAISPSVAKCETAMKVFYKKTEQVHLCLGTVGVAQNSPDLYAIHILNNIIGGSASSRLFQAIREERGLAYSIYSFPSNYSDCGLFSVYAGTRPENAQEVIKLILDNIRNLGGNITSKELYKAKEQLKGSLLLGLESSSSRMSRIAKQEVMLGKYISPEELVSEIDAVTMDDLNSLYHKVFQHQPWTCVALGPVDESILPTKISFD